MKKASLAISPAAVLNIPTRDAELLLASGNGDAALLYLHILKNDGVLDTARAATELHRSDRDVEQAADRLREMGILSDGAEPAKTAPARQKPLRPAQEPPEYPAREVAERTVSDEAFRGLVDTVQSMLGRFLSTGDLKKLFGIYHDLAMPADVIALLVQFCKERSEERYGRSRTVTMLTVEKEAYDWADREIVTHEQADAWIRELGRRRDVTEQLRRELGIRDRELTKTERGYITKWIELGFPAESIAVAADRTITNTQKLSWNYMDRIIASWDAMGIRTPQEIEEKDPRGGRKKKDAAGPAPEADDTETLAQLARIRDRMKNQAK